MDSFIFSVNATFPIFLTMLLGMFLRHVGLMDKRFADYLNAFVFKVALPVLLFQDLATQDFVAAWDGRYVLFCQSLSAPESGMHMQRLRGSKSFPPERLPPVGLPWE